MTTTDLTFFKPNELIAVIDQVQVNRLAKHLCNYLLKYAQEQIKFHDHQGTLFELDVKATNALAEVASKNNAEIETALKKLMQPVTIREKDDPKHILMVVPIYEIHVNTEQGLYQYRIAETVIELLRNTDYFTKLELTEFNGLESKHSIVIYEWLKRYEKAPQIPQLSVEELRKITNTANKKAYDDFSRIKDRILNTAVTEITDKTPYTVSYTTIKTRAKTRNKVTSIQFEFKLKKHDDIDAEIVEHKESDELERISIAEAISEAQEVLNKHFKSDDSYRLQCSYFLNAFLCTEEEYYRATQLINYKALSWWLENKKTTSLKYFIGDVKTGQRKGRFKDRIEFYKTMLGHLRAEQQELFKEAEGRLGFKSLLDRVLELLRDSRKLDDSWL